MHEKTSSTYSDLSASLHNDLCDVINMMGPPTPILPLDSVRDDTTITSNYTQSSSSDNSNTSFVEVIVKNHHKSKKLKIFGDNKDKSIYKTVLDPTIETDLPTIDVQHEDRKEPEITKNLERSNISKSNLPQSGIPSQVMWYPCETCQYTSNMPHNLQKHDGRVDENIFSNKSIKKPNAMSNTCQNLGEQNVGQTQRNFQDHIPRGIPKEVRIKNSHSDHFIKRNKENIKKCPSNCKSHHGLLNPRDVMERTELYYFDHGNSAYYHTTDSPPVIFADYLAEKTENAATRFWAQIFGMANLIVSLFTSFILQLTRFVLFSMMRPLTVGLLQIFSDYFLKPFLSVIFNALIQPPLIFIFNILISLRDLCEPIAQAIGFFLSEFANVLRAFRLIEYNKNYLSKESQV